MNAGVACECGWWWRESDTDGMGVCHHTHVQYRCKRGRGEKESPVYDILLEARSTLCRLQNRGRDAPTVTPKHIRMKLQCVMPRASSAVRGIIHTYSTVRMFVFCLFGRKPVRPVPRQRQHTIA